MFRALAQKSVKSRSLFTFQRVYHSSLLSIPRRSLYSDIDKSTDNSDTLPYSMQPPLILDGSVNLELDPYCDTSTNDTRRAAQDALQFHPNRIQKVHERYLNVGCNIITTSNFSVSPFFQSNFDFAENWRHPGSDWKYGDTVSFQSHWPTMVSSMNLCRLPNINSLSNPQEHHQHVLACDTEENGIQLEDITLEQQFHNTQAKPPVVTKAIVSPKPTSSGTVQCILPDLNSSMYQSPRLDCLVTTPLTKLFELINLSGSLAANAIHSAPLAPDAGKSEVDKLIGQWKRKRIIAGSIAPLFGPSDVQLQHLYKDFENNKKPSVLLETLWALAEYADGFKLKDGTVVNTYDQDKTQIPPPRSIHQCDGSLGILTAPEVANSQYRGVALSLYPYVDMFLCESIPSIKVGEMMGQAAMSADKPVMVSFQLSGDDYGVPRLVSCETLAQAVDRQLHVLPRFVSGYSVNCSNPAIITSAQPILRSITNKPVGAYAKLPHTHYGSRTTSFEHQANITNSPIIRRKHTLEETGKDQDTSLQMDSFPVDAVCEHTVSKLEDHTNIEDITLADQHIDRTLYFKKYQKKKQVRVTSDLVHQNTATKCVDTNSSSTENEDMSNMLVHGPPSIESMVEEADEVSGGNDYTTTSTTVSALTSEEFSKAASLVHKVAQAKPEDQPLAYSQLATFWASDLKADIIGGCCGISSVHAKQMAKTVESVYRVKLESWFHQK